MQLSHAPASHQPIDTMSQSEILAELKQSAGTDATMNNTVVSPVTATSWDDFQLVFNSFRPSKIMYYSYGLTVTLAVQFDNQQPINVNLTPGGFKTMPTPPGVQSISASIISAPSFAPSRSRYAVCVTF